jgi:ethylbenzene dioxygenase subunit beta
MSAIPQSRSAVVDVRAVEQFIYYEARLIDEQQWSAWSDLFADDGIYWMPATYDQPDPLHHVSLMYENKLLRAVRLRRFTQENSWSLQPLPRTIHQVSNIMIDDVAANGVITTNARQIVFEFRRDEMNTYGATVVHQLTPAGGSYKIKLKKVELVNCEGSLANIQVYL